MFNQQVSEVGALITGAQNEQTLENQQADLVHTTLVDREIRGESSSFTGIAPHLTLEAAGATAVFNETLAPHALSKTVHSAEMAENALSKIEHPAKAAEEAIHTLYKKFEPALKAAHKIDELIKGPSHHA